MLEKIAKTSTTAAGALRVKGALTPVLWLAGVLIPVFAVGLWNTDSLSLRVFFCACIALMLVTACGGFWLFAIRCPEKLQSEDYQIRHEALQIIQMKVVDITVAPAQIEQVISMLPQPPKDTDVR